MEIPLSNFSGVSISSKTGSLDLKSFLKKKCDTACQPQWKNEAICDAFCEFVDHIFEDHGAKMLETFNSLADHHFYETALDWSMEDTVRYIKQTYTEDTHVLGDYFMQAVDHWHSRLERGEEL